MEKRLSVLHFALGYKWRGLEQLILNNCLGMSKREVKTIVCCYESSPIDIKLKDTNILKIYIENNSHSIFNYKQWKNFIEVIREYKIDMIHCYHLKHLFRLIFTMRHESKIPIVFQMNRSIKKSYAKVWYRPFLARIDQIYLPTSDLLENVWSTFKIHPRKCIVLGNACNKSLNLNKTKFLVNHLCNVGVYFCSHEKNFAYLDIAFSGILALKNFEFKIHIFIDIEFKNTFVSKNLSEYLKLKNLSQMVEIHEFGQDSLNQSILDLWITLGDDDFGFFAISKGIPTLLPRNVVSMGIMNMSPVLGETYRLFDSNDLRMRCEKILTNYSSYGDKLLNNPRNIKELLGGEEYFNKLRYSYTKSVKKRINFLARRRLLGREN